ncbi:MAG: hypothetical protein GC162_12895 [Planctomycetes bacterium]|nr:hypothetical protein [Planctomycetota bacterium]
MRHRTRTSTLTAGQNKQWTNKRRLIAAAMAAGCMAVPCASEAATLTVTNNLLLHLDAGAGVTKDGTDAISSWADQATSVGGSNDATDNSGAIDGPTYIANGINGLPTVRFNGTSEYLQIAANSAFNSDQFTWFIVAQSNAPASTQILFRSSYSSGAGAGSSGLWGTFTQSGDYISHARASSGTFAGSNATASTQPTIITAKWASDDTVTESLNGVAAASATGATASPAGHQFTRVGANTSAVNQFFNGDISEVLVYNTTLSANQQALVQGYLNAKYDFVDTAALNNGLLLYSSMDDGHVNRGVTMPPPALSTNGGSFTIQNQVDPAHNGTASAATTNSAVTSSAPGRIGQAIDLTDGLDGVAGDGNSRVNYGDNYDITASDSQTISLWFNAREADTTAFIASKGNSASVDNGWSIWLQPTGAGRIQVRANYTGANNATDNLGLNHAFTAADMNAWHNLVLVIDNANGVFNAYYDGLAAGDGTQNGWAIGGSGGDTNVFTPGRDFSNALGIMLGARASDLNAEFNGLIDDFSIWNRVLSEQEVANLYNLGLMNQSFVVPAPGALPAGLMVLTLVWMRRK